MDEERKELICALGCNIEEALEELKVKQVNSTYKLYCKFNGYELTSDMSLDDAYKLVTGKTKEELDALEEKRYKKYKREEEEHKAKIPQLTEEYIEKAKGIIRDDKHEFWAKCVPIRLDDLYRGMELQSMLDIAVLLNEEKYDEAEKVFLDQGHSGMSAGLMFSMISEFCNNGEEFVKRVR